MVELLEKRRVDCKSRLKELQGKLGGSSTDLHDNVCVYVTGSYGRGEASPFSDLDAFIVEAPTRDVRGEGPKNPPNWAKTLQEDLTRACQTLGLPDFDRGGEFLKPHTVGRLTKTLGHPEDDAQNTFTARLLLLLESKPLLGTDTYGYTIGRVIHAYWRDYEKHKSAFRPGFLINDILRLWRTLCVNYEAHTEIDPPRAKAKRKLKNYKLKHSRVLTCYSACAHLLEVHGSQGTVCPDDVKSMVALTPNERLERLAERDSLLGVRVREVLDAYGRFLVPVHGFSVRFLSLLPM